MNLKAAYAHILTTLIQKEEAKYLLCGILGISKEEYLRNVESTLTQRDIEVLNDAVKRHNLGEPLSKIIGKREFWSLEFKVTKDTLDPRQDTETLIEGVLEALPKEHKYRFLELGVGSGCIIISLLHEYTQSHGVGVDISPLALNVAKGNMSNHFLEKRLTLIQSSWFENVEGKYDLIISNPPYISTQEIETLNENVKNYDPHLALDGGENGLECYESIAQNAGDFLNPGGIITLEIGFGQAQDVIEIFKNFKLLKIKKDLSHVERVLIFGQA